MKIAIIGSGDVGQTLARGLADAGYAVMIGTRNTRKKDLRWAEQKRGRGKVAVGSFAEAADFGEIVILAVAWHAAENVLSIIRPELSGKIVIDVTNPLIFIENESPQLSVGHTMSAGEIVQQMLIDSHVVKTLNYISYRHMVSPEYKSGTPTMFLCGDNASAKAMVTKILEKLGWQDTYDIGGIEKSRLLEPLCLLWVEYGVVNDTWNHAISILKD